MLRPGYWFGSCNNYNYIMQNIVDKLFHLLLYRTDIGISSSCNYLDDTWIGPLVFPGKEDFVRPQHC